MATEAFAHFPFFPEDFADLTVGHFFGGGTEGAMVAAVWRQRRWNLYGDIYVIRDFGSGPEPPEQIFSGTDPGYIMSGESNLPGFETSPFDSLDDILDNWRRTYVYSAGVNGASAGLDLWWGPRGGYDITGGTAGGGLDSEILFNYEDGDEIGYLGSQQDRLVTATDTLSNSCDVAFTFIDEDGVETPVPLFFDNITAGGLSAVNYTGTLTLKPGALYLPWDINGDDTWDTATGDELENPLRVRISGTPAYLCQQA